LTKKQILVWKHTKGQRQYHQLDIGAHRVLVLIYLRVSIPYIETGNCQVVLFIRIRVLDNIHSGVELPLRLGDVT